LYDPPFSSPPWFSVLCVGTEESSYFRSSSDARCFMTGFVDGTTAGGDSLPPFGYENETKKKKAGFRCPSWFANTSRAAILLVRSCVRVSFVFVIALFAERAGCVPRVVAPLPFVHTALCPFTANPPPPPWFFVNRKKRCSKKSFCADKWFPPVQLCAHLLPTFCFRKLTEG